VAFSAVASMFAQQPSPPSGQFYGPIVSGSWQVKFPRAAVSKNFVMPQPATSTCSIPLLGAQIPKDVDFKIKQIAPPAEKLAPMPQVKGPAPTCESWPAR